MDSTLFNLTNDGALTFVTAPDYENPKDDGRNNGYEVKVTASDGTDNSAELTLIVNVTNVNEPPPPIEQLAFSAAGTADTTSMLLLMWTAPTLPDGTPSISGYEVHFRVQGETNWTAHDFESDGSTTEATITGLASNTSYDAQVRAVNVEGPGGWSPTSIAKTAEARLTVAFSAETYTVDEGDTVDITVNVDPIADRDIAVTITITGEGATLSGLADGMLTIERGANSGSFAIAGDEDDDATDDEVTLTLDADQASYVFPGSPSTTTVTIVDDEVPNKPPAFATTSVNRIIAEDSPVGSVLGGPIAATDPEGDSLTYTLSGEGSVHFEVNNQGQITLSANLNHEDAASYTLTLSVRDSKDDVGNPDSDTDASIAVNVTVGDVDEPPDAPTYLWVSTNEDNPTAALDVIWTAPDTTGIPPITGYDVRYRVQGETDWVAHNFASDGSTTKTTVPNLASNTTYQIQVRAKNDEGEGQWATDSGTTEKADLTVAFSSATYTVNEGSTTDINVNVAPTADRNVTVTLAMTGTGATLSSLDVGNALTIARGQGSASFTISGNHDNDAMDDVVTLTLTTNADGVTLGSPSTTTVTIEEPNNPPVITTTSPITVKENQTAVATLEATDSDDDPITGWSITGGADRALFSLTNDGVLTFNTAPDYENPSDVGRDNSYEVEVTATDGTDNSTPMTLTVNVTNVNEPPTFSQAIPTTRTVAENSPKGTHVGGSFTAVDPEDDALVYKLSGTGHENFAVDANGQITVTASTVLDFETQQTYTMDLSVSDAKDTDGNSDSGVDDTLTVTINLTDLPKPPQMDDYPGFSTSGTDDTTSMLLLTWTAPTLPDGAPSITSYEVQYRMQNETHWTDHEFDSDGSATETTLTDLASNTNYEAQVRAVNIEGRGGWSPTSSAITTQAKLTVAFSAATYTVDEGDTADITVNVNPVADRDVIVIVHITDGTGATLSNLDTGNTLTITRDQNSRSFTISGDQDDDNATDDEVTLTLSKDEDTYNVVLGNPATVTIVDDEVPNFPPTFATTTVTRLIPEDSPVGTPLGNPIAAFDPEGDSLTYEFSGEGSEHFDVNDQGQISLRNSLNYEGVLCDEGGLCHEVVPSYTLILSVRDSKDDIGEPDSETDASVTVNVTVGDVDEPPGGVDPVTVCVLSTSELLARWSIAQNSGPRLKYQVQYRVDGGDNWIDLDYGDDARETTILGLASNTTYQVRVRGRNDEGDGPWSEGIGATERAQLTMAFGSTAFTVDEGTTATTTVMVTPAADRDVTVTITMTGSGATLSGLGTGNKLNVMCGQSSTNFFVSGDQDGDAVDGEVSLTLGTDDDKVNLDNSATITIIDDDKTNLPPQFATTTVDLSVPENLPVGTLLGDPISATDPEGDPLTYSLSGEGSEYFEVSNHGQVALSASLNHEDAPSYTLIMSVSDSKDGIGEPDSETDDAVTLNIGIEDVVEPPDAPTNVMVSINVENPTTTLDVIWIPPDTDGIPPITDYNVEYRKLGLR